MNIDYVENDIFRPFIVVIDADDSANLVGVSIDVTFTCYVYGGQVRSAFGISDEASDFFIPVKVRILYMQILNDGCGHRSLLAYFPFEADRAKETDAIRAEINVKTRNAMALSVKFADEVLDRSPIHECQRIFFVEFSFDKNLLVEDDICGKLDARAFVLLFAIVYVGELQQFACVTDFITVVDHARDVPPPSIINLVAFSVFWNKSHRSAGIILIAVPALKHIALTFCCREERFDSFNILVHIFCGIAFERD